MFELRSDSKRRLAREVKIAVRLGKKRNGELYRAVHNNSFSPFPLFPIGETSQEVKHLSAVYTVQVLYINRDMNFLTFRLPKFLLRSGSGPEFCDRFVCQSICLSVCVWAEVLVYVQIARARGSVLLWRRCDTLCTSGLWMTSRLAVMGRTEPSGGPIPERSLLSMNGLLKL